MCYYLVQFNIIENLLQQLRTDTAAEKTCYCKESIQHMYY